MICVVVLQNCVGFVEGETGDCSETGVKCNVDGFEEVNIKVEEAIDIKDEIPEAITCPTIKTEHEVRLWGVCEEVAAHAFRPFIAPKGNCENMLNYFLPLCYDVGVMYFVKFGLQS
jgi:hypothetical protein